MARSWVQRAAGVKARVRVLGFVGMRTKLENVATLRLWQRGVRLFTATTDLRYRALLMTAYAAGLRASELGRLQVTDIDSARMCLRVEQGKGNWSHPISVDRQGLSRFGE